VRLRDIIELLAGAHIGASGHHIISQGEADRILNANMRERREMIEDALGLKIYQWKREESEKKLEKTEENMKQVQSLRREIAPHISFLKKQVERVERTKQLQEELCGLYREYLFREHAYITATRRSIVAEEHASKDESAELERALATARNALTGTHEKDAEARAIITLGEKLIGLRKEREALSRELGRLEGEIAGAERMRTAGAHAGAQTVLIPLPEVEEVLQRVAGVSEDGDASALKEAFRKIRGALKALLEKYRARRQSTAEGVGTEIQSLADKKREAEEKLAAVHRAEKAALEEERVLRAHIDKERDSSRDTERSIFRIMTRQSELRTILGGLNARLREVEHAEADFKREQTEGALLAGREILEYEKAEVKDESGTILHLQTLASEDRTQQEERRRKIERLKIRIEEAGGGNAAEVVAEFEDASKRDEFLARELADLEKSAQTLGELIAELEQKLGEEFRAGVEKINQEFQRFFVILFGGGTAKLALARPEKKVRRELDEILASEAGVSVPEEEKLETGIEIEVSLPRKKIKGLMMLSGGERALTSIALLFAMSQVKPPPFIILDETDAALDEANSKKYGDMVENLSKHSQLILITHNRETMSRAGVIYGVTMDKSGVSKLLSIAFDEAVQVAK
jgi:chromosome segregation protein